MRFLSVCSGIEAASAAWGPLGWSAVAFAEIEPFPCAVLAHHYPSVPNWGDMTKFEEWPDVPIDLLCGGTPCQSFSVAGLRAGLADPRGNLALTYLAIAAKYRPRWLVWENVPGVFSALSHDAPDFRPPDIDLDAGHGPADGEEVVVEDQYDADESHAFGCFLAGLSELGYGWAYRVLDAQYFGVAQRRRRPFVVGYFGDWRRAAAVLFERHSLSGNPAPSRQAGQGFAASTAPSLTASGRGGGFDVAHALTGEGFDASEDGTGRGTPLVPISFSAKDHGADASEDLAPTLRAGGHTNSHANAGVMPAVAFQSSQSGVREVDAHATLDANNGSRRHNGVIQAMQVRRLIPEECEALQGFKRSYTAIPYRGKPAADGPRYKALGNSWAVPCARWIGERIEQVERVTSPPHREA
jgi:DNA (cytosine-5)-methyltransferase 1